MRRSMILAAMLLASSPNTFARDALLDDQTRGQIAEFELFEFAAPSDKGILRTFRFPKDADDGIYGFDVSHHNGTIDWAKLKAQGASFVYIKATQGKNFEDKRFKANWKSSKEDGEILRGAYHFLTPQKGTGREQADNFIGLLEEAGGLQANDLTPVMDLEWSFAKVGGKDVDLWSQLQTKEIVTIASDFLKRVEEKTGRKPVIYTAASWWKPNIGNNQDLNQYPHWIADYRNSSINNGAPAAVSGPKLVAWQFTDIAKFAASGTVHFDANKILAKDLDALKGK
ncbi:hypothetical protein NKI36_14330 [Mesorhizobium caraganae]|uniref:Lysozyme n=1 Tax=Mesorhizobium caraganae TaxID=483206 RepID=A0ABV1YZP1_9HYPH